MGNWLGEIGGIWRIDGWGVIGIDLILRFGCNILNYIYLRR